MAAIHAPASSEVTELLIAWQQGDESALERLTPLVYAELHQLAASCFKKERGEIVLQTTALVHEACLRLMDQHCTWQNRAHFFAVAATLMRRILTDLARQRKREKRGGNLTLVEFDEHLAEPGSHRSADVVALDDALNTLAKRDERKARVVELRFFGGLSIEETASVLRISTDTVKRDWRAAKLWLLEELSAA